MSSKFTHCFMYCILAVIKDTFEDEKDNNNFSSSCNRMRIFLANMGLQILEFDFTQSN